MLEARTALVRATMSRSSLRLARTASSTFAAMISFSTMCSRPTWWWARFGSHWSSISMAWKPAASLMAMVRRMCIGSPKPAAASKMSGSGVAAPISMAVWHISVSVRLASRYTFR